MLRAQLDEAPKNETVLRAAITEPITALLAKLAWQQAQKVDADQAAATTWRGDGSRSGVTAQALVVRPIA